MRLVSQRMAVARAIVAAIAVVAVLLVAVRSLRDATHGALGEDMTTQVKPGATLLARARGTCGSRTSSGTTGREGVIAAHPSLLPAGSVITLEGAGPAHDGTYTVLDENPELRGSTIELFFRSCRTARAFGERSVQVRILRLGWEPEQTMPGLQ